MMVRVFFLLSLLCLAACLTACTAYERNGSNPKPFNAPAGWELNPYDGRVRM